MGLDIFEEDSSAAALPARLLGADESKELYCHASSRLPLGADFRWQGFAALGLSREDAVKRIGGWPGDHVFALFLDNVDERVLPVPKAWFSEYLQNYVYPGDNTYILSADRRHCLCFDRHDACHYSPL